MYDFETSQGTPMEISDAFFHFLGLSCVGASSILHTLLLIRNVCSSLPNTIQFNSIVIVVADADADLIVIFIFTVISLSLPMSLSLSLSLSIFDADL